MAALTLTFFGDPQVELDGVRIDLGSRKALALLAYVVVTQRPHRRDTLTSLLWPESPPDRACANLRDTLWLLNKHLPGRWLDVRRHDVAVRADAPLTVDVLEFQRQLAQAAGHAHAPTTACPACLPALLAAIDLYRADFLQGFTLSDSRAFDDWQSATADAWREHLLTSFARVVQYYADRQEFRRVLDAARRWVAVSPWSEAAHRALMHGYAGTQQRSAALQHYQACVRMLRDEFGAAPERETQALYDAIVKEELPPNPLTPTLSQRARGLFSPLLLGEGPGVR